MKTASTFQTALVVIPGTANYFYNQAGRRAAQALREAGWQVKLTTLGELDEQEYAWGFLVNLSELLYSRRLQGDGWERLRGLRTRCHRLAQVLLECATTHWFAVNCQLAAEVGAGAFFDFGLHDQSGDVPAAFRKQYRFVLNGLLTAEWHQAQQAASAARPIPWAVVGHQTPDRVQLVERLVREYDARGFFYLPQLEPVTEQGPHLNERQFQHVLERTQYQVWCSHHPGFYLEGERFRASLLAGGLPLKVTLHAARKSHTVPASAPFHYLITGEDFPAQMKALPFEQTRRRFIEEFGRLPRLSASLIAACAQ
jgi:hypothetical protein